MEYSLLRTNTEIASHGAQIDAFYSLLRAVSSYDGVNTSEEVINGLGDVFATCITQGVDMSHMYALGIGRSAEHARLQSGERKAHILGKALATVVTHPSVKAHSLTVLEMFRVGAQEARAFSPSRGASLMGNELESRLNLLAEKYNSGANNFERTNARKIAQRVLRVGAYCDVLTPEQTLTQQKRFELEGETYS